MSEAWPAGPSRPSAGKAEVHLWRAALDSHLWPGPEGLPAAERERAASFLRAAPRARWVASRWALRGVLARYLDEQPAEIELEYGEHGKPRLAGEPGLRFNLSHSGAVALIAVSGAREVGVDVERVEADRDPVALAEWALEPADAAAVRAAPADERAGAFHELWARHEARLKCLGTGLAVPRGEAPAVVATLPLEPGYAAAVAVAGDDLPLRRWTFAPPLPKDG